MARDSRTYGHFCTLARALERVGDRWSLLVVRDLLSGRKRYTDLAERLGGITPKTLTQRLRDLEAGGIVRADRVSGRREVWYELTEAGLELGPVVDALGWWGMRHAWRPPRPGESLHVEHLLRAIVQAIAHTNDDREPACWLLDFRPDDRYVVVGGADGWRVTTGPAPRPPDVTVTGPAALWPAFVADPTASRAVELGFTLTGDAAARGRFLRMLRTFAGMAEEAGLEAGSVSP
jgi:DNA-binding HxlR family transcriptional regulator